MTILRSRHLRAGVALLLLVICVAGCNAPGPRNLAAVSTSPLPPVYLSDKGDGTYQNPILFADYSDPDAIRVGDDFYMTASSFSCFPGLPILHSKDLVSWTIIGHAVERYPFDEFNVPQHGNGIWAPSLRFQNGRFFIFFGDPDRGLFMTSASNPAGPWSPLHLVKSAKGWIDCCPFWDEDGRTYLVHAFARSRAGFNNRLDICRMAPDGSRLFDEGTTIFNGGSDPAATRPGASRPAPAPRPRTPTDGHYTTVEGPKLYKRGGFYYVFAPGGGVTGGYQIAFRSKDILGPYESRVVLDQGNTPINGPHQGAWVQTQTGQDWFIHFQDRGPYGRITHLQPMQWINDWPVIGDDPTHAGIGHPVLTHPKPDVRASYPPAAPQTSDEFEQPTLGLQWQWFGNFQRDWADLKTRRGWLRLRAMRLPQATPLYNRPNLLLQKFPAESFTASTVLDAVGLGVGESAGLVIVGRSTASLAVRRLQSGYQIARTQFQAATAAGATQQPDADEASATLTGPIIYLRVHVTPVANAARATFEYSPDGRQWTGLGQPFIPTPDQWIGAKIGVFCNAPPPAPNSPLTTSKQESGYAEFDYFHFER